MTFIHFINCSVLTFGPLFVIYKASKLKNPYSLVYTGLCYLLSQFIKLFLQATFVPSMHEDHIFHLYQELMVAYITVIDVACLYIFINNRYIRQSSRSEQLLYISLGWTTVESVLERLIPLWIGARAIEFQWNYILLALGGTLSIFYFYCIACVVWLWTRRDLLPLSAWIVTFIFILHCILPLVYKYFDAILYFSSLELLGVKTGIILSLFVICKLILNSYDKNKIKRR